VVVVCSLPERGSVGDRLFAGGWQLTLMKRMKKRLTDTADHYRRLTVTASRSTASDQQQQQQQQLCEKLERSVSPLVIITSHSPSLTTLTLNQPLYLTHPLAPCTPGHSLRSRDKHSLSKPAVSNVIGSRRFSYAAPAVRNKLSTIFAIAHRLLFFTGTLRHIIFSVPGSLRHVPRHLIPLATARASDSAVRLTMRVL